MKNKNILFLLSLSIILLLSLTAISANTSDAISDYDISSNEHIIKDTTYTNENNINTLEIDKNSNIKDNNINSTEIKENTLSKDKTIKKDTTPAPVNTASQLGTSGNYYLTNDISLYDFELTGPFVLDGKGHTVTVNDKIKAEYFHGQIHIKNTIFTGQEKIKLECGDVLLENCTFINFRSDVLEISDDAKDPQRTSDEKVLIRNCTFQNNMEDSLKIKECEATIENCNFNNCRVSDGVIVSKRATVIVKDTNITSSEAPAFYIEKGGSIYIQNVIIDGINQTKKQNTSNQYYIRNKDGQTGQIILPDVELKSNIKIMANNTKINQENPIILQLSDESNNPIANALIKITITDTTNKTNQIQKATDNQGTVKVNQTSQFEGTVTIAAIYEGQSGSYTSSNNSINYTVTKQSPKQTLAVNIDSINTIMLNTPIDITIYLTDINSNKITPENMTITINSNMITPTINNKNIHVTYTPTTMGNLNITAIFGGNDIYASSIASKIITVTSANSTKKKTTITMIDDMDGTQDGFFRATTPALLPIKFNITDEDGNEVTQGHITIIELGQTVTTIDLSTGVRIYNYDTLSHPFGASIAKRLTIKYQGTSDYEDSNNTFIIAIIRAKTTKRTNLTVNATNTTVNNNNTIVVTLTENAQVPIANEMVNVTIDGIIAQYTTDSNGLILITNYTSSVAKNTIPVVVNYGGSYPKDLFAALEQSTTFNVLKNPNIMPTKINIIDSRDDANDNIIRGQTNQSIILEVNVTDSMGNPVREGIVTFKYINDVIATIDLAKSNMTEYDPLQINIPVVTARRIKLEYQGTNDYEYSNTTFTLSIKRSEDTPLVKISINATNTTVGKNNTIIAQLTGDGTPIANEKIILNIDGKDYQFTTNTNGQVIYTNYTSNESKMVSVIARYDGNSKLKYMPAKNNTTSFYVNGSSNINKTTTIQLVDTHDDQNNGKILITNNQLGLIEFNVLDEENKSVNKGLVTLYDMSNNQLATINLTTANRTFAVNSLSINFSASKAGYFKLNYTGVDQYQDSNTKFMVSLVRRDYIQTLLTVNATDTTVNQKNTITVKLTSMDNRPIFGEKVALKITDKTYYVTTNKDGIGQYKIFTYPMQTTLQVIAEYPGNNTKYYLASNNTTKFSIKKATNISTEKTTSTLYLDKHDGVNDYLLDVYTDRLNKIEYIVLDVNGNEIKEGNVTLYVNGLNKYDTINMSTKNKTFIFNPLKYNYTSDNQTAFTIYYTGVNGYENSLATIKTTVHKIQDIPTKIELTTTNTTINKANQIKITLKANDMFLDNQKITVTIDNKNYTYTTDNNGQVTVNYSQKTAKNNIPVVVKYAGDTDKGLKSSQNQSTFNVIDPKHKTALKYNIINITSNSATLNVILVDDSNKLIPNEGIEVTLSNGTKLNMKSGVSTVINLPVGKNTLSLNYKGNAAYYNCSKNITITIPKHNTTINLKSNNKYYVGANNLTGTLLDENKKAVGNSLLNITCDGNVISAKTDKNGKFTFNATLKEGQNNLTITFAGNNNYNSSKLGLKINAVKLSVKIIAENITALVGDNITIKVKLIDENNNPVINGKVLFKSKGLTLKEDGIFGSNAPAKVVTVTNGTADVNVVANTQLRRAGQISVNYAGSNKYLINNSTSPINVTILRRNASITVKTQSITNQDTNLLITAYVYDITGKNKTALHDYEDNFVIFKVNGITIKNSKGEAIQAKIVNGVAQINYTVPVGLAGKYTNLSDRYYTVLAVLGSLEYNQDVKNTTTFKVNRSEVSFNNITATLNTTSKKLNIKAKLQDYHNNMLKGQNTVVVKINGLSYKENDKLKVFSVLNGSVDITLNVENIKNIKNIMLVTGQRVGYLGGRNTTTNITRV